MFIIAYDFCYPSVWSLDINMSTEYMVLGPRQGTPLESVVVSPQRYLCWAMPPVLFLVPLWSNNLVLRASGLTSVQLHPIEQTCKTRKLIELCTQTSLLLDGHVLSMNNIWKPLRGASHSPGELFPLQIRNCSQLPSLWEQTQEFF